jgi:hypothetical protein
LVNPEAIITTSKALVKIQEVSVPPKIEITPGGNNTVHVSWSGQPSEFVLENAAEPNGGWTEISTAQSLANGRCYVSFPATNPLSFFRLKKVQ